MQLYSRLSASLRPAASGLAAGSRWWAAVLLLLLLGAGAPSLRAEGDLDQLLVQAAAYESGQSAAPFRHLEDLVRQSVSQPAMRRELEAGLIQLLAPSATFEARRFACKQLGIIGGDKALPALAELLPDEQTAGIACLALTTYPAGKADELLRRALGSAAGSARVQIINTLGDRRDAKSVPLLAGAATGADRPVAEAAISALGKIGDAAARKAIGALAGQADAQLQAVLTEAAVRCAAAMAKDGERKAASAAYEELLAPNQPAYVRRSALAGLLRLDKDGGEARVLQVLHGTDAVLKPVAISAIRTLPGKQTSKKFAEELPQMAPAEQVWLVESLGARGDAAARVAVERSLESPEAAVRQTAAGVLARFGDQAVVPLLAQGLAGAKEAEERRAMEAALVSLPGTVELEQAMVAALSAASGGARASLVGVLARRQGPAANPTLLREAAGADPQVAKAAWRALGRTAQGSDVPALLNALLGTRAPEVLAEAENAAIPAVARVEEAARRSGAVREALMRAPSPAVRSALLGLLPGCGDAPALSEVSKALAESDPAVQESAIRALADWPTIAAWEPLAGAADKAGSESLRAVAFRGLARLAGEANAKPDTKLVERYRQLFATARSDAERRLVLGALAGASHPAFLSLAEEQLSNPAVRPEAVVAVKKIATAIKGRYPRTALEALQKIEAK